MANNIFIGPNSCTAKQTKTFAELSLNATNTSIVYEVGATLKSWVPGRGINAITGVTANKGYYIIAKTDQDLSDFFTPPLTGSGGSTLPFTLA
jgi:hypothetical protein